MGEGMQGESTEPYLRGSQRASCEWASGEKDQVTAGLGSSNDDPPESEMEDGGDGKPVAICVTHGKRCNQRVSQLEG